MEILLALIASAVSYRLSCTRLPATPITQMCRIGGATIMFFACFGFAMWFIEPYGIGLGRRADALGTTLTDSMINLICSLACFSIPAGHLRLAKWTRESRLQSKD